MKLNDTKIYQLIERKGLKVNYLIDNSGVSRKSFYDYLNNRLDAPHDFVLRLANNLTSTLKEITD